MGDSGGGGDSSSSTTIPPEFIPFFVDLFEQAQVASGKVSGEPFEGELVAPFQPQQEAALAGQEALAGQFGGLGQNVLNLGQQTAQGAFLSPDSNPFLQGAIDAGVRPIFENLRQQVLPGIRSEAIARGAFGGSREGITEALAGSGALTAAGDVASRLSFQNLTNERQLQQNAPALIGAGAQLQQVPNQILGQVGDVRRSLEQEQLNAEIARFKEAAEAPFRPLFPLASIIQGTNVGQTTKFEGGGGGLGGAIQGGLGGAASGAAVGSFFGPPGTAIGAGLGGLLGAFGGK